MVDYVVLNDTPSYLVVRVMAVAEVVTIEDNAVVVEVEQSIRVHEGDLQGPLAVPEIGYDGHGHGDYDGYGGWDNSRGWDFHSDQDDTQGILGVMENADAEGSRS